MLTFLQIAAIVFVLLLLIAARWYSTIPSNLPPGPIGLPIFGSMFDTWNAAELPTKLMEWRKIYGPLYKMYIAERLVLILGDYESIYESLVKQGDAYAGRPYDHDLISPEAQKILGFKAPSDDDVWKEERRFLIMTLRDLGVSRSILEPKIEFEVKYMLEQIDRYQGRSFDPADFLSNRTANVMCGLVFGKSFRDDHVEFCTSVKLLRSTAEESRISMLSPYILSERFASLIAMLPQAKTMQDEFSNNSVTIVRFLQKEIAQQKLEFEANNSPDYKPTNYVQAFFKAQHDKGADSIFTYEQLIVSVFNLFTAGVASTAMDLRMLLFYMARYPEWQEEIYREIRAQTGGESPSYADRLKLPLIEATIMEGQRLSDGLPLGTPRKTLAKSKLFGYDIPSGTVVIPLLTAAMKDPKVYPNPNEFDPRRFLKSETNADEYKERLAHFMPFQVGKRACSGESIAKMELFSFLAGLIARYEFSYSPDEPWPSDKAVEATFGRVLPTFKLCAKARNS